MFKAYDPRWCNQLFERFDLLPLLSRSPFALSEGQKKRVSFAAALSIKPFLVVLDEPTAGQDEPSRSQLTSLLKQLREEGQTILFVTHDLEFAAEHANRWLVLSEGKLIADGAPDEVMAQTHLMIRGGLRPTQRFQLIQALHGLRKEET